MPNYIQPQLSAGVRCVLRSPRSHGPWDGLAVPRWDALPSAPPPQQVAPKPQYIAPRWVSRGVRIAQHPRVLNPKVCV